MATLTLPSFSDAWSHLKNNKLFWMLVLTFASSLTNIHFTMTKGPPGSDPQVNIILPDGSVESQPNAFLKDGGPLVTGGPLNQSEENRLQFLRFKVRVAKQMASENKMSFVQAFTKCNKVTQTQFAEMSIKAGCPPEAIGDGTFLKNIFAWISDPANQEKVKQLIKFFMELALAFG